MEEYDNEFNIHYSSDEEDKFDPNDIVADDILDKKQNSDDDESQDHEELQDNDENQDDEEQEILPKTVFFKQRR